MATSSTNTSATKTAEPKAKRITKDFVARIDDQLSRAVLAKKLNVEQLTVLKTRVEKLIAFIE